MASISATIAAVLAIGSAGVAAHSHRQAGKAQDAIAQFNAMNAEKAAQAQLLGMQTQAALQKQQAEANFKLRQAEANARNNNASAIESQALQQDRVNRVNAAKKREEMARMQGQQRANIAASGAVESSGTPLDILAETAAQIQAGQEEDKYASEVQRWTLLSEAQNERFGGRLALAGATLDRDSDVMGASLRDAAAKSGYLADLRGAAITRLTGRAAKAEANNKAIGSILGGVSDAARLV